MNKFILDGRYADLLAHHGIRIEEALRKAQLPGDAFCHKPPVMKEADYYRFMEAVGSLSDDPELPIKLACTERIELFSPPIFASYCSRNGRVCLERLARYKRLVCPLVLGIEERAEDTEVTLSTETEGLGLPPFVVASESAFLVGILRKATRERICPLRVRMKAPARPSALEPFFGVIVEPGDRNAISFRSADLLKPFISHDESMWQYFAPELSRRLCELDAGESVSARVRSALTELIPGGACAIEDVAARLGLSRRTLQRKLSEEGTTFQKQLNHTRELLAIHYFRHTDMSVGDIAYLLGYQEVNSFLRAFTAWTGMSVTEYRKHGGNAPSGETKA